MGAGSQLHGPRLSFVVDDSRSMRFAAVILLIFIALVVHVVEAKSATNDGSSVKVAVIVFACSRPSLLRRTLRSLAANDKTLLSQIDIYISVDAHRRADQ